VPASTSRAALIVRIFGRGRRPPGSNL